MFTGSAAENSVLIDAECLSFQCPEQSKKFLNLECHTPNARICNRTGKFLKPYFNSNLRRSI